MAESSNKYYVPDSSPWPLSGSIGLFMIALGAGNFIQQSTDFGQNVLKHEGTGAGWLLLAGALWLIATLFFWWRDTIKESISGLHEGRLSGSYRQGMIWFIFSEVMFFAAFFGALFYVRVLVLPWLSGEGNNAMTNQLLWPLFEGLWSPLSIPSTEGFTPATGIVGAWGVPAINTALLLTSGATLTWAHWGLFKKNRGQLIAGLALTVLLGSVFMVLQVQEYAHAMNDLSLTFNSGIYGSLFYLMTGFHGAHVTLGVLMLTVILARSIKGHFTPENHFAFEGVAWYWHFVDVVWLILFVFIYWV